MEKAAVVHLLGVVDERTRPCDVVVALEDIRSVDVEEALEEILAHGAVVENSLEDAVDNHEDGQGNHVAEEVFRTGHQQEDSDSDLCRRDDVCFH